MAFLQCQYRRGESRDPVRPPFFHNPAWLTNLHRYAPELPVVLKGITFTIRGGERIAIVGRTGSGKVGSSSFVSLPRAHTNRRQSTLAMSLLRCVDPIAGSIRIDGLDISKMDLETLRQRISIIPQGQSHPCTLIYVILTGSTS